jgi:hypothetical protein
MTDWLAQLDWMVIVLVGSAGMVALSLYRAHRDPNNAINLMDLFLENGRVSRLAVAFMLTLALSTWIMIDLELHGKMTEGYLTVFGGLWVAPIIAKLIFNQATPPVKS